MSEAQACATCRFWEEQSKRCRRYAPRPTLGSSEYSDGRQNAFWVLTNAEDWCGDYESILGEEYEEEEQYEDGGRRGVGSRWLAQMVAASTRSSSAERAFQMTPKRRVVVGPEEVKAILGRD